MAVMPKSPISLTKKAEAAVNLINAIDTATDKCIAAPAGVRDLLSLYRTVIAAGGEFSAMAAAGFTSAVLGPKIAEIIGLPEAWDRNEPTYIEIKNTHLPAFAGWVASNQAAILATAKLDAEGFVTYGALPANLQAEAAPLLANIAASYGA